VLAAVALVAALAAGCGSDGDSSSGSEGPRRVVVDTDMANDDILALLFLLQRDDIAVEAVTVAGTGEVHCVSGVRHARTLLALTGHAGVPVACGRPTPLVGDRSFPDEWRDAADRFYGLADAAGASSTTDERAVELLDRTIRSGTGTVSVLALGPLTNVADALLADPLLVGRLDEVVVMGGALDVPGNVGMPSPGAPPVVAEWNTYVDPHAANVVFGLGEHVTLVPLDATNRVPIDLAFVDRLTRSAHTTAAETALTLLRNLPFVARGGSSFWDPLAAAVLAEPSLATFDDVRIRAVEADGARWGATEETSAGALVRAVTTADADRFEDVFLSTLDGRPAAPPVRVAPDVDVTCSDAGCTAPADRTVKPGDISIRVVADTTDGTALVVGRLGEGHTMADVRAVTATGATSPSTATTVPPWFEIVQAVAVPPVGAPTWVFELAAGEYAVVAASLDGAHVTPLTALHVQAPAASGQ
jgi:pyrimidine-specific ribonucleoside hydrolase